MSFIKNIEPEFAALPDELRATVIASLTKWDERVTELKLNITQTPEFSKAIVKVWCSSLFVAESCIRKPELLIDLVNSGDLSATYNENSYTEKLVCKPVETQAELMTKLRDFRRREMVRIAWRDLAGWAELSETLTNLSWLADACIQYVLDFLYQEACELRGTPLLSDGSAQQIVVLGMGKLGAYELNYSSDIDLIFAYAEDGVLQDRKETTYGEFFTRLCRNLVKVLDEITVDGFVFRTDIRLRPYGDSGPIIMTFDGMENYYQTQAREWERYAMIKVRQVAGDFKTGAQLMAMFRPFVYRRYLDYGAFEELRSLKAQITQELRRKDRMENIKLGPGGIREIEFIGQAFQLIRGGNDKALQTRPILDVLQLLGERELLAPKDADQLNQSYCFLRRVENHIQQYQDQQTHDLPTDPAVQRILAYSLDYSDWTGFKQDLDKVRAQVHEVFDQVFSLSKQDSANQHSQKIWACVADDSELMEHLKEWGIQDTGAILAAIKDFKHSAAVRRLTAKGAGVLDRLMPQLIEDMQQVANPDETLLRILGLFEAVAGRNVYLSLLSENPGALAQLIKLSSASPWICGYLSQYPVLFDELLDTRSLYEPLKKADFDEQLKVFLAQIEVQDLEQLMVILRQFKQLNVLRVAAADIMGAIPLMVVSDYLTYIAESIVSHVVERAWLMLTDKHGLPPNTDNAAIGFAVIGFGKLGGIELGYGSDLDLVFLYDCQDGNAMTDGGKPISCAQFYGRLGLKVRHILDTKMLSGVLYEVDMRLRPNGDSGLLVSHINAYEDYLKNQAWTWELQALVRGRFIAGDAQLKEQYEAIRSRILSLPRDTESLKKEVREMREKMREALSTKDKDKFDLKQSKGGIADIEFIVQFGVLDQAALNVALTTYTDNVRLLEGLQQQGFMSKADAETLKNAYCTYRDFGHKQVLQGDKAVIDEAEVAEMSAEVERIWHECME
ncbi:bifunctional [glutamate--ammonia ligase]-adenylyl-L-tyrosine phosphorylase/[glutamate--ammonia-ligase] adenylyltransferase [Methylobacter sp.]|uniref:bifunctional [glutamate--ammonia ligase]-adenylyl-L-tyrosine phosphorylase/[glutamate--ammonia-ligase] adenylyltransferase n=1 Tax=Methylobacter sp. TaxID=2051955 RepID=UPI002487D633|nr:bifunctional [glutamate--ammonia ligase]-adenylyl-L-tyrosine phosphorylase/[glutamate--ammonia-ligase] adenylyltransferase [Methylobacter sp.]MDI1276699.1 bifunctional [glutamate--ammonia ligase]-adenylyl-L-tyrosine phosphorylase/[glutamate--ammonia-ligase] adenylyltransferase [Methylobacter sp.]MDI1357368.1 bifunctional [glutamate--ammonia ligase]-adenylyl-L-tyrosine phosphorylase/[glutamate--ammonia-ligase] adenylyltransferase [Methylobacter sp.]